MKLLSFLLVLAASSASVAVGDTPAAAAKPDAHPSTLRVASVQMRSVADLHANVTKIKRFLADCAARHVAIVAFPECAVSSYSADAITAMKGEDLMAAEKEIAEACRENSIAAVVGVPERRDGKIFNTALIIDSSGKIVARYDKAQPVGQDRAWQCAAGEGVSPVFNVGAAQASVIVCHDSRFPELSRLPVLAGSRVIFYISSEAILVKESKMAPYRAQVQAIAAENSVFVVHANPPADSLNTGSHGQSRIVGPDGNVLQEASQLQEEVLVADLDLSKATAEFALESLQGPMKEWWREGLKKVQVIK